MRYRRRRFLETIAPISTEKSVIVTNEDKGCAFLACAGYPKFDILESENREYQAVVLGKSSGWRPS